jgi:hypothetical protein
MFGVSNVRFSLIEAKLRLRFTLDVAMWERR